MATAPNLDADTESSRAEKGKKPIPVAPGFGTKPPSPAAPDTVVNVPETEQEKGLKIFTRALLGRGGNGKKKTRKQKKRAQKKTQKRRGRK